MGRMIAIDVIEENCRGCRSCETACARHDPVPFNPRRAGIRVIKDEPEGRDYPVLNIECLERFCGKQEARATDALEPACVTACLFGALQLVREVGHEE